MKKKILIEGMSCSHCIKHVKEALLELEGVHSVEVDLTYKAAILEGEASDKVLKEAIEEVGYDVITIENI